MRLGVSAGRVATCQPPPAPPLQAQAAPLPAEEEGAVPGLALTLLSLELRSPPVQAADVVAAAAKLPLLRRFALEQHSS